MAPRAAGRADCAYPMNHRLVRAARALALLLAIAAPAAHAQTHSPATPMSPTPNVPQNVIQLSASGQVEVVQDLLTLTLGTAREGADAAGVQAALKQALDEALRQVGASAPADQMEVRTGAFRVHPRHDRNGRISGWQGRAELVLEGRDFARITQAAARATTMVIDQLAFGLSRTQRARAETEAQTQAIERFKARASDVARAFGFAGYTLREVSVSGDAGDIAPRGFGMASRMEAMAADAPVPVEPGRSLVQVTVSGTVQAH